MSNWHHLVFFLADNVTDMQSVRGRRVLLNGTGFNHLIIDLVLDGTSRTFCNELLQALHRQGQQVLINFLESLRDYDDIGPDNENTINEFIAGIRQQPADQFRYWRQRLPRIYLTYQPAAGADPPLLDQVREALAASGFDVIELAPEGEAQEQWRSRLLRGIGDCHGGVILLDKETFPANGEAILEQNSYMQDVALLRWRDWRDKDFILVPVQISGSLETELAKSPWRQLELGKLQPLDGADSDAVIQQILERLAPLHRRPTRPTWIASIEKDLAATLRRVKEVDIQRLEDTLYELGGGIPGDEKDYTLERRVARALLNKGLQGLGPIIERAAGGQQLDPPALHNMLDLFKASWVELPAAALIPHYTFLPPKRRIFCVNGMEPEIAGEGYVQQACQDHRGLAYNWLTIQVNEDNVDAIIEKELRKPLLEKLPNIDIRLRQLKRKRKGGLKGLESEIDRIINEELASWEEDGMPVFVIFGPDQYDEERLQKIWATYPRLTFFLLVGNDLESSPIPGVDMLVPPLQEGAESKGFKLFLDLRKKIPKLPQ